MSIFSEIGNWLSGNQKPGEEEPWGLGRSIHTEIVGSCPHCEYSLDRPGMSSLKQNSVCPHCGDNLSLKQVRWAKGFGPKTGVYPSAKGPRS